MDAGAGVNGLAVVHPRVPKLHVVVVSAGEEDIRSVVGEASDVDQASVSSNVPGMSASQADEM